MNQKNSSKKLFAFLPVALLILACGLGQLPTPTPVPTRTPAPTFTFTPVLSPTPSPTLTPDLTAIAEVRKLLSSEGVAFCAEKYKSPENEAYGIPASAPYDSNVAISPVIYCTSYAGCNDLFYLLPEDLKPWVRSSWMPAVMSSLQLILCQDPQPKETPRGKFCTYAPAAGGALRNLPTFSKVDFYDLYATKTGELIQHFEVPSEPLHCPAFVGENDKKIVAHTDRRAFYGQLFTFFGIGNPPDSPLIGDWIATADFGELRFTVDIFGVSRPTLQPNSNWACAPGTTGSKPIYDFTFAMPEYSFSIKELILRPQGILTISGTYHEAENKFYGDWSAVVKDTTCSGTWQASPAQ